MVFSCFHRKSVTSTGRRSAPLDISTLWWIPWQSTTCRSTSSESSKWRMLGWVLKYNKNILGTEWLPCSYTFCKAFPWYLKVFHGFLTKMVLPCYILHLLEIQWTTIKYLQDYHGINMGCIQKHSITMVPCMKSSKYCSTLILWY